MIYIKDVSISTYTLDAGTNTGDIKLADYYTVPDGCKIVAVIPRVNYTTGANGILINPMWASAGIYLRPYNISSVSVTFNLAVTVVYTSQYYTQS